MKQTHEQKTAWLKYWYNQRHVYLLAFARQMLRNEQEAEDAVQEAFIKLWIKGDIENPQGFLNTVIYNYCLNELKMGSRHRAEHKTIAYLFPDIQEPDAENLITYTEIVQQVSFEIIKLPPGRRRIIEPIYFENKTNQEVAALLGITDDTVRAEYKRFVDEFGKRKKWGASALVYQGRPLKEVCVERNISFNTVIKRMYRKKMSVEESLNFDSTESALLVDNSESTLLEIEYMGQTKSLNVWSKELKLDYKTLYRRIFVLKWPVERAFTEKTREQNKLLSYNGEEKTMKDWCEHFKINLEKARYKLWRGWTLEEIFTGIQKKRKRLSHHVLIEYKGEQKTCRQWCAELNLSYSLVLEYMRDKNMSFEDAIAYPPVKKRITYNGKTMSFQTWCQELGLVCQEVWHKIVFEKRSFEEIFSASS